MSGPSNALGTPRALCALIYIYVYIYIDTIDID
eukprot:SAG31_NODE_46524_length_254_cov_0.664516_1_plen_32_part_10